MARARAKIKTQRFRTREAMSYGLSLLPVFYVLNENKVLTRHPYAATTGLGLHIFEYFSAINTLSHPIGQMIQMTGMAVGGVLDRFPRLRIAFLEAGATWALYMMERLDRS